MKSLLRLLLRQAAMDFRKRYLGTLLGILWAIASPLITICLIYFVFTYGLKAGVMGNVSFINWFVPGMLIWFYMSEVMSIGTGAITESSYLVTKIIFPVYILPLSKVVSCLPVHILLMSLVLLLLLPDGGVITVQAWWQLLYYLGCATLLSAGIVLITSSAMVFVRDTAYVVGVVIQIFFWATPIFWDPALVAETDFKFILLSPFNYVLQGYRDSLFGNVYFWQKPLETIVFWGMVLLLFFVAIIFFKRTRPHFADVL